jgi:hypothetical protein
MVQRLRNQELKQAGIKWKQVWRLIDGSGRSTPECMVCFLPNEFMAPANQIVQEEVSPDIDEAEQFGLMAHLVLANQATFDKPAKKSAHETAVLERIRQWEAIDQDVC